MKTLLAILLFICFQSFGQNVNNVWYFGDGNFLDFNTATPTVSAGGTSNPAIVACNWSTAAGASMMCNNTGQLQFYSDGSSVWDATFNLMPNGTGLFATGTQTYTASQSIIIPNPSGNGLYYLFHTDVSAGNNGLRYSEIDMSLNGGLGNVTANKNVLLHANTDQRMKAITHCNGQDVWLISHDETGNSFKAYLVTATGVSTTPVVSNVGTPLTSAWWGGYMACSKDGTRIAIAGESAGPNPWPDFTIELFYFDNQTGNLCNPILFNTTSDTGGIEFSADGTKLYVCEGELQQYDISSNVPATIEASFVDLGGNMSPGVSSIMRGPDDKIYVTTSCQWSALPTALHVINNPNQPGITCNYQLNLIPVLPRTTGNLPTFYAPTQTNNTCGPTLTATATASSTNICITDCITYTSTSVGPIVSYDWTFQGGTPSTFNGSVPPQVCYATAGTYTTTLTVTDCAGNTSSTDIIITVSNCTGPTPDFQANQTQICSNDCVDFSDLSTGTNVNAWAWSFPGGSSTTSNVQNPQNICYATPGSYDVSLTVTDDFGTNTVTLNNYIVVDACIPPIANFSGPDTICVGNCINFSDQSLNNPTQWDWVLNGGTPVSSTVQNPQSICFNTVGTYSIELTATNAYGNDVFVKDIVVISAPNAGNDVSLSLCETEAAINLETLLDPGVPLSGTWVNAQNTPAFTSPLFSPSLDVPGTYTIYYVLENAFCADSSEFSIEIHGIPNAGADGSISLCDYDAGVDLLTVLQGNPDPNGTWSPPLNSGTSFLDPSVDLDGIYTYTVPQTFCGQDSAKATVTITYLFDLQITPVGSLCTTDPGTNLAANIANGIWSGPGITDNSLGAFDPSVSGTGSHTITYTVSANNCEASTTSDIIVDDLPQVNLTEDFTNCVNEPVHLSVQSSPGDQVMWSNGSTSDQVLIDFENAAPGQTVMIGVDVTNGCGTSSDEVFIELIDCDYYVYIPNSFTPDGNGHNQLFEPVITGEGIDEYQFRIFNRWGELVFTSATLNEGWDGTIDGKMCQDGIYIWTLSFKNTGAGIAEVKEYNGHISLIR